MNSEFLARIRRRAAERRDPTQADAQRIAMLSIDRPSKMPQVGLWWWFEPVDDAGMASNAAAVGDARGVVIRLTAGWQDAPLEDGYRMIDDEHILAWPLVRSLAATELALPPDLEYDGLERGRVWYHPGWDRFSLTCAAAVTRRSSVLQPIRRDFGLAGLAVHTVHDPQYDAASAAIAAARATGPPDG